MEATGEAIERRLGGGGRGGGSGGEDRRTGKRRPGGGRLMVLAWAEGNLSGRMFNAERFFFLSFPADGSAERHSEGKRDINEKREKWKLHPGEKKKRRTRQGQMHASFCFLSPPLW